MRGRWTPQQALACARLFDALIRALRADADQPAHGQRLPPTHSSRRRARCQQPGSRQQLALPYRSCGTSGCRGLDPSQPPSIRHLPTKPTATIPTRDTRSRSVIPRPAGFRQHPSFPPREVVLPWIHQDNTPTSTSLSSADRPPSIVTTATRATTPGAAHDQLSCRTQHVLRLIVTDDHRVSISAYSLRGSAGRW